MGQAKPNRRYLYSIKILRPSTQETGGDTHEPETYTVLFSKNFGDMFGGTRFCENIECLKGLLKNIVKWWGECDSILNRVPDKVTRQNLYFESCTPDIALTDALGMQTLNSWLS